MTPMSALWNTRALASIAVFVFGGLSSVSTMPARAADTINGRVLGAGSPIANSTVTLWAASTGAPAQVGQARTDGHGQFSLNETGAPAAGTSLYLVATGGKSTMDKSGAADNQATAVREICGSRSCSVVHRRANCNGRPLASD